MTRIARAALLIAAGLLLTYSPEPAEASRGWVYGKEFRSPETGDRFCIEWPEDWNCAFFREY